MYQYPWEREEAKKKEEERELTQWELRQLVESGKATREQETKYNSNHYG